MTPALREVIQSHATQGHTMAATAYLLDWPSREQFVALCEREGLVQHFQAKPEQPRRTRQEIGRASVAANSVRVTWQGVTATYAEHARRLGIKRHTVSHRRRVSDDLAYIFATMPQYYKKGRAKRNAADKG